MYSSRLRRDTPQNKHQLKSLLYILRGGGKAKRKSGPMARSRTLPNAQRDFINFIQNSNLPAHFVQLRGDGSCFYRGLQHFRPHGGASRWRFLITGRYGNDYAEDFVRGLRLANLHATVMTIEIENPNLEPFIFDVGPQNGDTVIFNDIYKLDPRGHRHAFRRFGPTRGLSRTISTDCARPLRPSTGEGPTADWSAPWRR